MRLLARETAATGGGFGRRERRARASVVPPRGQRMNTTRRDDDDDTVSKPFFPPFVPGRFRVSPARSMGTARADLYRSTSRYGGARVRCFYTRKISLITAAFAVVGVYGD